MSKEALINHRNLVNYNEIFWETKLLVDVLNMVDGGISISISHRRRSHTTPPARAAKYACLMGQHALLWQQGCLTRDPEPRRQSHDSAERTFTSLHSGTNDEGSARKTNSHGEGTPTTVLIQFCVCSSLIYQHRHEPTSRCLSQSFQQCHLTNSSGLQQLIF